MKMPQLAEGIVLQSVGEELLIYDQRTDHIHSLNESMALVARACDGETDCSEVAARVGEQHLNEALHELSRRRLVNQYWERDRFTSRRKFLKVASIAVPVVTSMMLPQAAAAASGSCIDCTGTEFDCGACTGINGGCSCCGGTGSPCPGSSCICLSNKTASGTSCADDPAPFSLRSCIDIAASANPRVQLNCGDARTAALSNPNTNIATCGFGPSPLLFGLEYYCCEGCS